jgi:hypothetical protein
MAIGEYNLTCTIASLITHHITLHITSHTPTLNYNSNYNSNSGQFVSACWFKLKELKGAKSI